MNMEEKFWVGVKACITTAIILTASIYSGRFWVPWIIPKLNKIAQFLI